MIFIHDAIVIGWWCKFLRWHCEQWQKGCLPCNYDLPPSDKRHLYLYILHRVLSRRICSQAASGMIIFLLPCHMLLAADLNWNRYILSRPFVWSLNSSAVQACSKAVHQKSAAQLTHHNCQAALKGYHKHTCMLTSDPHKQKALNMRMRMANCGYNLSFTSRCSHVICQNHMVLCCWPVSKVMLPLISMFSASPS